jgi:phage-related protein
MTSASAKPKPLYWAGSSRKDFGAFPAEVQDEMGYALYLAQMGKKHDRAKPLKGFGGAGVLEAAAAYAGDAYRTVYTVRFADAVYVLHVFQKKSKHGIATPHHEIDLIKTRLREAQRHYEALPESDK